MVPRMAKYTTILASFGWGILQACSAPQAPNTTRVAVEASSEARKSSLGSPTSMAAIWERHSAGDAEAVIRLVDEFTQKGGLSADMTATGKFLQGDSMRRLGRFQDAERVLMDVYNMGPDVGWQDPKLARKLLVQPMCRTALRLVKQESRSPYPDSSQKLTAIAWSFLAAGKLQDAQEFARDCVLQYQGQAREQQREHDAVHGVGKRPTIVPKSDAEEAFWKSYWALCDVATCHFITGKALSASAAFQPERADLLRKQAVEAFQEIVSAYPSAQCFDANGPWYWSVADGATQEITALPNARR